MTENQETAVAPISTSEGAPAAPLTFDQMGLRPEVLEAVTAMGFLEPTEVQRVTFDRVMAGKDIMVQSRTGSGKTAAFAIPMAEKLIDPAQPRVQALALCPTRELALQVASECTRIGVKRGLKVASIYGGAPMGKQIEALKEGAQVVAGTPGRVLDHLRRGTLVLDHLRLLVLDECDEMLSMGFYEEISEILKRCPPTDVRQTLLFSATIPEDIERIGSRYMRDPEKVMLSTGYVGVQQITHAYYMVSGMGRSRDLVKVLRIEKPDSAIIFCNTREETSNVAEFLRREGMDAEAISSDLTQKDRERVMGRMRAGNLHYLVATDIAARGIDISDLSHVINYTFPESAEVYVHRTGRTGRAGKSGIAISLISPRELGNFYYLKLTYKIRPDERMLPTEEEEAARRDGERVEEVKRALGEYPAPNAESVRIARLLWAAVGGEAMVAALVERLVAQTAPIAAAATAGADPTSDGSSATPDVRREYVPRSPRSRTRNDGRSRREDPREERPERSPKRSAPPAASSDPAANAAPGVPASRSRTGAAPAAASSASGGSADKSTPTAKAEVSGAPPREKRERRRRRREPGAAGAGAVSSTTSPRRNSDVIEAADGRDFWEVWAEGRTESDSATPRTAADEGSPAAAEARPEIPPGTIRLFLNLGQRDHVASADIRTLLGERELPLRGLQIRQSHTYLFVDEADADRVIAGIHGQRRGERDLICERARRS